MASLLRAVPETPIDIRGSRVLCAVAVPASQTIVASTEAAELVCGEDTRVSIEAQARILACVQYAFIAPDALPEEKSVLLALVDGIGLRLYSFPELERIEGELEEQLENMSRAAHIFSVDSLGSDLVGESFRVAMACDSTVFLLEVNLAHGKMTVLGESSISERVVSVAFSEMTIVASTARTHYMLRISRGGGLAEAASVMRSESARRQGASAAVGDSGAAFMSFFGGLFGRRDLVASTLPPVALALPDNRWLLVVDQELVTYSSFGAKLDDMENVFKSKVGMGNVDFGNVPIHLSGENGKKRGSLHNRSTSASSLGSMGTVSHMTLLDEAKALRAEKPPVHTVFSSPFVFSVGTKNEVLVFAANGSIPGVIETISLDDEVAQNEVGVKLICARNERSLVTAYWPSGRVVRIELVDDLDNLIKQKESDEELRLALALVPSDQVDRMIALRRLLAAEARAEEWHDAAIHHMQNVVDLSIRREGVDQIDLVAEAVELRGSTDSNWKSDMVTATMWADFLFRLRRRVMRPSPADVDVLETLCRADESATRIKALLSVKYDIPLSDGESLIASSESSLREEERVDALVALYTSSAEHGKALLLLENSETGNSFNGVVGYLTTSMRSRDEPDVFFSHLKWLAHEASTEAQGKQKLQDLVLIVAQDSRDSEMLMGRLFEVLVEEAEDLLDTVVDNVYPASMPSADAEKDLQNAEGGSDELLPGDVLAAGLLAGMAKSSVLEKQAMFEKLRSLFGSRILYREDASYRSYTLLQALQLPEYRALGLHEELAFLLGRQGRHEQAADELAAEKSLGPDEALSRLNHMLPSSEKPSATNALVAAYLRVSAQGRAMRTKDASDILRLCSGTLDVERLIEDGRCSDDSLKLADMLPFMQAALISGSERLRLAEILKALRKSEVRRMREEVLTRRKRFVLVGHDRACTLCTRRIGDSVFAAYPDGTIAHLACHMSRDSR